MKITRDFIDNESESKINWAANGAALYSVVNKEKLNLFGEYPGYRFFHATGNAIHSTIQKSSNAHNAINFGTHAFYATQQKDTEPHVSHQCNTFDLETPLIDFNQFFNDESLVQEDLYDK
jgi:primary-amine oxidase